MKIDIEKIKEKKSVKDLLEFGIINIDKPSGPTSFDVSEFVMKTLGLRKTSHFGTLDPKVTGVLPIALNRACKFTGFFLGEDKEYVGIMRIHEDIDIEKVLEIINKKFLGKIMQKPPVKSRVLRVEREREIKSFEVLEKDGKDFLFKTEVQGGTYIRKLVDDLGKELGIGAHMLELRRTRAGIFKEEKSVNLYELEKAVDEYKKSNDSLLKEIIIPGEIISELYPAIQIKEESAERILRGQPIYEKNLEKKFFGEKGKRISVFSGDKFIGVYSIVNESGVFAKPDFVLQPIR
jgi:H/ACA ribonucleoprotein complex subunit 4